MMKICFSAIFGNYDDLKEPQIVTPGWRYILFTDQDYVSKTWEVIKVPQLLAGAQRTARYYKILFYNEFNPQKDSKSIWVDASFIINCNLDKFWEDNFKGHFAAPQHPLRNCVYKEIEACLKNHRDGEEILKSKNDEYYLLGIPRDDGMISSGILLRDQDERVKEFCMAWWRELESGSVRDQIAFGKINNEMPGVCMRFDWDYTEGKDFIFTTHLHKRHKGKIRRRNRRIRADLSKLKF